MDVTGTLESPQSPPTTPNQLTTTTSNEVQSQEVSPPTLGQLYSNVLQQSEISTLVSKLKVIVLTFSKNNEIIMTFFLGIDFV